MSETLYELALAFRVVECKLAERKAHNFKKPTPVRVDAPRYQGYGVTWRSSDEKADEVSVLLENGNIWRYPVETVKRVEWSEVDAMTRRRYLAFRGKWFSYNRARGPRGPIP